MSIITVTIFMCWAICKDHIWAHASCTLNRRDMGHAKDIQTAGMAEAPSCNLCGSAHMVGTVIIGRIGMVGDRDGWEGQDSDNW